MRSARVFSPFRGFKLAEGDQVILEALELQDNEKEMLEHIILQMELECSLDRAAAIADMRFHFIQEVCGQTVVKPQESREHARSTRIDRILTGKYTAIPVFIAIMGLVFLADLQCDRCMASDLLDME